MNKKKDLFVKVSVLFAVLTLIGVSEMVAKARFKRTLPSMKLVQ